MWHGKHSPFAECNSSRKPELTSVTLTLGLSHTRFQLSMECIRKLVSVFAVAPCLRQLIVEIDGDGEQNLCFSEVKNACLPFRYRSVQVDIDNLNIY
eukprot:IDg14256t1